MFKVSLQPEEASVRLTRAVSLSVAFLLRLTGCSPHTGSRDELGAVKILVCQRTAVSANDNNLLQLSDKLRPHTSLRVEMLPYDFSRSD